jgi:F0F1-type ATP synthase alpha subunit
MLRYFEDRHKDILDEITTKKELSDDLENRIKTYLHQLKQEIKP